MTATDPTSERSQPCSSTVSCGIGPSDPVRASRSPYRLVIRRPTLWDRLTRWFR